MFRTVIFLVISFFLFGLVVIGTYISTREISYFQDNIVPELFGFFMEGFFFVGLLTLFKYINDQRELKIKNEKIDLYLKSIKSGYEVKLPISIPRSTLNRVEIFGRLGSIATKKPGRFSINFLTEPTFFEEIERVRHSNTEKRFTIWCSTEEIEQFQVNEIA